MTELLKCPFCGGDAFIYYSGNSFQFGEVVCEECGCRSCRKKVDETIEAWNTRKPVQDVLERLEDLRGKPTELAYDTILIGSIIEILKEGLK